MKTKSILAKMHNNANFYELPWALTFVFVLIHIFDLFGLTNLIASSIEEPRLLVNILLGTFGSITGLFFGNSFWKNREVLIEKEKKLKNLDAILYVLNKEKNIISSLNYQVTEEEVNIYNEPIFREYLSGTKEKEIMIIKNLCESIVRGEAIIEGVNNL